MLLFPEYIYRRTRPRFFSEAFFMAVILVLFFTQPSFIHSFIPPPERVSFGVPIREKGVQYFSGAERKKEMIAIENESKSGATWW